MIFRISELTSQQPWKTSLANRHWCSLSYNTDIQYIIKRLMMASASANLRLQMNVEEAFFSEIDSRDAELNKVKKEMGEKNWRARKFADRIDDTLKKGVCGNPGENLMGLLFSVSSLIPVGRQHHEWDYWNCLISSTPLLYSSVFPLNHPVAKVVY